MTNTRHGLLRRVNGREYLARGIPGSPCWLVQEVMCSPESPTGFWAVGEPQYINARAASVAIELVAKEVQNDC